MADTFQVVVGAGVAAVGGRRRGRVPAPLDRPGVTVDAAFTGAHLLHLAAAGCVLNDLYREADGLGLALDGVRVTAEGGFDTEWSSTGVSYVVDLDTAADAAAVAGLLARVDEVAEIPRALRAGTTVTRRA